DKVEKDPSAWQDDTAYLRFPGYYASHRAALTKALGKATAPVAETDNPEVLLSERAAEEGRYLFVVNDTPPDLDPGQLWRARPAARPRPRTAGAGAPGHGPPGAADGPRPPARAGQGGLRRLRPEARHPRQGHRPGRPA